MKYLNLDPEEIEIEKAIGNGALKPIKNVAAMKKVVKEAAALTLSKTKNINIRLPEKVLVKLKARAIEEGLPYQTLVSSILHRYVHNALCP
jgi:predicted DNA binding CopG/RHH family protein